MIQQKLMHRIGVIGKLAEVPVSTLRVWESRYRAFSPGKTEGKHRLYSDQDLLKATLLKQLCRKGHAISTIAQLDLKQLNELQQRHASVPAAAGQQQVQPQTLAIAVVGMGLAARIESSKFTLSFLHNRITLSEVHTDIDAAKNAEFEKPAQILLVKTSTLHEVLMADIQAIASRNQIARTIVIYNYGTQRAAEAMKRAGIVVRREPVSDHELADLVSSVLLADPAGSASNPGLGITIPMRKYSEDALARATLIPNKVQCECIRHVAETISQLASFEQYSKECLNQSPDDSHLHAHLVSVSGSARAMFEGALDMVSKHLGIDLNTLAPAQKAPAER